MVQLNTCCLSSQQPERGGKIKRHQKPKLRAHSSVHMDCVWALSSDWSIQTKKKQTSAHLEMAKSPIGQNYEKYLTTCRFLVVLFLSHLHISDQETNVNNKDDPSHYKMQFLYDGFINEEQN